MRLFGILLVTNSVLCFNENLEAVHYSEVDAGIDTLSDAGTFKLNGTAIY